MLSKVMAAATLGSEKIMQKTGMQYLLKAFCTLTNHTVEIVSDQEEAVTFLKKENCQAKVAG